jgi:hypothetical protein
MSNRTCLNADVEYRHYVLELMAVLLVPGLAPNAASCPGFSSLLTGLVILVLLPSHPHQLFGD